MGGFEQCYNGQCAVEAGSMLIAAAGVTQAGNDKQQIVSILATLKRNEAALGLPAQLSADAGFYSAANVNAYVEAGIEPLIAMGREPIILYCWRADEAKNSRRLGAACQWRQREMPTSLLLLASMLKN